MANMFNKINLKCHKMNCFLIIKMAHLYPQGQYLLLIARSQIVMDRLFICLYCTH